MSRNGAQATAETEIVRASELGEKVVERIAVIREPELLTSYKAELRKYKRRKGKRDEVVKKSRDGMLGYVKQRGYIVEAHGQEVFVPRPERPRRAAYHYSPYDRSFGSAWHARSVGLLADPRYNREIRPQRVAEYGEEMQAGRWQDLLSDPIAITAEGDVLNGQHRIAAAVDVDWSEAGNDPAFLVVWNADSQEALHADGSRRTARDEKTIATKLVA